MDRDLAMHIIIAATRASTEIGNLAPLVKRHCNDDEYKKMPLAIGASICSIQNELLNYIYSEHPELEKECENRIEKFGFSV